MAYRALGQILYGEDQEPDEYIHRCGKERIYMDDDRS